MRSFFDGHFPASLGERAAFAPQPADAPIALVLAANVAEVQAIPAGARFVIFSATDHFFARFGTSSAITAAVPVADVTDGTAPELNPAARQIPDGATHIALIASAATTVVLSFYGI